MIWDAIKELFSPTKIEWETIYQYDQEEAEEESKKIIEEACEKARREQEEFLDEKPKSGK